MSPLATKIYNQLAHHARRGTASVTYRDLATAVGVHHRSPSLHVALGEVTNACRHAKLPCLPALVCRAGGGRPSSGYYAVAHPRAHTDEARHAAWEREHAKVLEAADRFPRRL